MRDLVLETLPRSLRDERENEREERKAENEKKQKIRTLYHLRHLRWPKRDRASKFMSLKKPIGPLRMAQR